MRKGVYTVETAMVMGIVLTLMLVMMFLMFSLHDRAVLYSVGRYYLCEAENAAEEKGGEEGMKKAAERFVREANDKTYFIKTANARISKEGKELVLTYPVITTEWKREGLLEWLSGDMLEQVREVRRSIVPGGATFVRAFHGVIFRNSETGEAAKNEEKAVK